MSGSFNPESTRAVVWDLKCSEDKVSIVVLSLSLFLKDSWCLQQVVETYSVMWQQCPDSLSHWNVSVILLSFTERERKSSVWSNESTLNCTAQKNSGEGDWKIRHLSKSEMIKQWERHSGEKSSDEEKFKGPVHTESVFPFHCATVPLSFHINMS